MMRKIDLTIDSSAKAKLHALIDAHEYFDAGLVEFTGRDNNGKVLCVAACATGEDAVALHRFLKRRALADRGPALRKAKA